MEPEVTHTEAIAIITRVQNVMDMPHDPEVKVGLIEKILGGH